MRHSSRAVSRKGLIRNVHGKPMSNNAEGRGKFGGKIKSEFQALSTKQVVAIIVAIAAALIMEVLGLVSSCLGILIIAVVLYMIPHLLKVTSVSVKAVVGVVFVVLSILIGTVGYASVVDDTAYTIDEDTDTVRDVSITYDEDEGVYRLYFEVNPTSMLADPDYDAEAWGVIYEYTDISMISFGMIGVDSYTYDAVSHESLTELSDGWYSYEAVLTNLSDGKFEYLAVGIVYGDDPEDLVNGTVYSSMGFTYDSGITTGGTYMLCLYGSAYSTVLVALFFFVILGLTAVMRGSATKSREKMESEGRLYPQGYGRCKECNAMVLPGEVVCRKCGAPIDVPEEMRPKKKDYFTCSVCGGEVPGDATVCPRCGATFDEPVEVEVDHADGTVEVSAEPIASPPCGESVPANAAWCPQCGNKVKEDRGPPS